MNTTLILSLGISLIFSIVVYFFLRKRISSVDKKVNLLMQLVKEHHQQVQQQSHIIMREKEEIQHTRSDLIHVSDDDLNNDENYSSDDSREISDTESVESDNDEEFEKKNLTIESISLSGAETHNAQVDLGEINNNIVNEKLDIEEISSPEESPHVNDNAKIEISLEEFSLDDDMEDMAVDDDIPIDLVQDTNTNLSKLKVPELKNKAKLMGLEGYSNLKKKELINFINSQQ
tara:strand:- start:1385 stop:2080 length:696 start_codon:yes stop_codon:yes gene_type:complete